MKAKNLILSILFFIPSIFFACENYDEQERLQLIEGGETTDNTPITQKQEKVTLLLEDFTGWDCPNCPEDTVLSTPLRLSLSPVSGSTNRGAETRLSFKPYASSSWKKSLIFLIAL